jgi:hypothetical protein
MKGMLGWPTRSAKRNVCRYGCCIYHEKDGQVPTKVHRKREKKAWNREEQVVPEKTFC